MARDYAFPYPPYSIQIELMNKIYESLDNGKISIIESPTGTGKSLSIICATLKWIEDFKRKQVDDLVDKIKSLEVSCSAYDEDDDWMKAQSKKLVANNEIIDLKAKLEDVNKHNQLCCTLKKKTKSILKPEDGGGDHRAQQCYQKRSLDDDDDVDCDLIDYSEEVDDEKESTASYQPKVFYCSRTHSQLSQFVQEIKKTKYWKENDNSLMTVVLASRANYCINPAVSRAADINMINEKCKDLQSTSTKCAMSKQTRLQQMSEFILGHVQDIEDIVNKSKNISACPYYSTRMSIPESEIVILPYNILMHKATRESYGIDLQDSVVIVDEAHNLIETIANVYCVEINLSQLESTQRCLVLYMERYKKRFSCLNLMLLKQLMFVLKKMIKFVSTQNKNDSLDPLDLVIKLEIEHINMFRIINFINKSHLAYKLRMFSQKDSSKPATEEPKKPKNSGTLAFLNKIKNPAGKAVAQSTITTPTPPKQEQTPEIFNPNILYNLNSFFVSIKDYSVNGKVLVSCKVDNAKQTSLKYILLDPSVHFEDILTKCRSVVLCGGTMKPFEDYINQLFKPLNIGCDRYLTFSCDHVIDPNNLIAIGCPRGVGGQVLNYNYTNRSREQTILETGNVIVQLCSVIPKGVVVFFPSYDYADLVLRKWEETKLLQKCGKRVFQEPKKAAMVPAILSAYSKHINSSPTSGAILFSVVGGKMSEGINFSDDMGRGVIVVGLPYANRNSIELQEKMKFLDSLAHNAGNVSCLFTKMFHNQTFVF